MATLTAARLLPSVDELLKQPALADAQRQLGHELVLRAARRVIQHARDVILGEAKNLPRAQDSQARGQDSSVAALPQNDIEAGLDIAALAAEAARLAWRSVTSSLQPVINATGVVIHTNLGRAPLCAEAIAAMQRLGAGYSNLEFDLASGKRGDRQDHIQSTLQELLGVDAAIVVNNNASAVLLALTALARGKEVIVSRGQAVEIGGGFRIPDVMRRSGARLVEVGTTNRTYIGDFEDAIGLRTAALMRIHSSNFRVIGFTHGVAIREMVDAARRRDVLALDDLGSGALLDTAQFGLMHEPTAQESAAARVDVMCFSGDKLLGGPQAGILAGKREVIQRCKRDPLMRAMRTDKATMAALEATLLEYLKGRALETVPVWRMISAPGEELRGRAEAWASQVHGSDVIDGRSAIGGGSLPEETLPTALLRLPGARSAQRQLAMLRAAGVIARVQDDRVVLDPRTVQPGEDDRLLAALGSALG